MPLGMEATDEHQQVQDAMTMLAEMASASDEKEIEKEQAGEEHQGPTMSPPRTRTRSRTRRSDRTVTDPDGQRRPSRKRSRTALIHVPFFIFHFHFHFPFSISTFQFQFVISIFHFPLSYFQRCEMFFSHYLPSHALAGNAEPGSPRAPRRTWRPFRTSWTLPRRA